MALLEADLENHCLLGLAFVDVLSVLYVVEEVVDFRNKRGVKKSIVKCPPANTCFIPYLISLARNSKRPSIDHYESSLVLCVAPLVECIVSAKVKTGRQLLVY